MLPITILALALLLSSCATPNPLAPYSAAADGLVMLENLCEDPWEDVQTLTAIEAIADMFALPLTMAVYTLRLAAYFTVGVGMVLAGKDAKATVEQINYVLPMPLSGPDPDRVVYHADMVKEEGCLWAALTGE